MGKGYYLVQYDPEKKALRNVSAGALGGMFTMEEFWTEKRVNAMVAWLTAVYGTGWVLVDDVSYEKDLFTNEDVGYTEKVRTAAVAQGWTSWKVIRERDFWKYALHCHDRNGEYIGGGEPGFEERYIHLFTRDELEGQNESLETYMGSYWRKTWAGKSLEEVIELGNRLLLTKFTNIYGNLIN